MSIYGKTFVLTHTFKNISAFREGDSCSDQVKRRCNIPWTVRISRIDGFLGVYLYCELEWSAHRKWSLHTKYTMKLVAVGGKFFRRTV
ncbi:MATH domain-containing protein [Caenorhabditis elegans]|uniref:MATH domain-containing protein n=1 Tax=Caenorhabditis elegans TaxID=6239 RepID=A0A5S9MPZ0_CAEEL|nr:MATH domain-containing protein [Caenorhabditis elegans]CAA0059147.1 MATH domain-containing protein [Caenorhabditis elegans]